MKRRITKSVVTACIIITAVVWASMVFAENYVRELRPLEYDPRTIEYREVRSLLEQPDEIWFAKRCSILEENRATPVKKSNTIYAGRGVVKVAFVNSSFRRHDRVLCK